jgi:hypothetical protein
LVEAGVDVLTTSLNGPRDVFETGDDHAVNHNVFEAMKFRSQAYDQAVSALIEDIYARGLISEFWWWSMASLGGLKDRIFAKYRDRDADAPAGTTQPGSGDHWPRAFIWAGGESETGRFIGATDKRGERFHRADLRLRSRNDLSPPRYRCRDNIDQRFMVARLQLSITADRFRNSPLNP